MRTNKCNHKIEKYIDKLEIQTDKLIEKVDDSDNTHLFNSALMKMKMCFVRPPSVVQTSELLRNGSPKQSFYEVLQKTKHSLKSSKRNAKHDDESVETATRF